MVGGLGKEPYCKVIDSAPVCSRCLIAFDVAVNERRMKSSSCIGDTMSNELLLCFPIYPWPM